MQIKDSSFNGQTPALLALIISFGLGVSSKVPSGGADLFFFILVIGTRSFACHHMFRHLRRFIKTATIVGTFYRDGRLCDVRALSLWPSTRSVVYLQSFG